MNYINRSSDIELYDLLHKLNVKNVFICKKELLGKILQNKKIKNIIVNIGNSTHWVAINTTHKLYFDSYAQPPPNEVPRNYKLAKPKKEVQSIDSTDCGQLCALWLYYINYKSNDEYFELFKDVYG